MLKKKYTCTACRVTRDFIDNGMTAVCQFCGKSGVSPQQKRKFNKLQPPTLHTRVPPPSFTEQLDRILDELYPEI